MKPNADKIDEDAAAQQAALTTLQLMTVTQLDAGKHVTTKKQHVIRSGNMEAGMQAESWQRSNTGDPTNTG